jgi:hypothetical protein
MRSGYVMPQNLARKARIEEARLVFLPFYVVTAHAVTEYEGVFERTGQSQPVKDIIDKDYQWTVLGRRSTQFPEREYKIPLSGKASFDVSYVQGEFLNAELDEEEAYGKAEADIEVNHTYLMKEKVDRITSSSTNVDVKDCEFLHAPVWFVEYVYNNRTYHLVIDGATGQVIKGDIPMEERTFPWIWIAAVLVILLGVILIFL